MTLVFETKVPMLSANLVETICQIILFCMYFEMKWKEGKKEINNKNLFESRMCSHAKQTNLFSILYTEWGRWWRQKKNQLFILNGSLSYGLWNWNFPTDAEAKWEWDWEWRDRTYAVLSNGPWAIINNAATKGANVRETISMCITNCRTMPFSILWFQLFKWIHL